MSEIKSNSNRESDTEARDYEFDIMRQKLEQEQYEKHLLLTELENVKSEQTYTARKSELEQGEIGFTFIATLKDDVESYISRRVHESEHDSRSSHHLRNISQSKLLLSSNPIWQSEIFRISSEYNQDYAELQNQYRSKLHEVVSQIFTSERESENYLREAILKNTLQLKSKMTSGFSGKMEAQVTNNQLVLNDIDSGKVFDDIIVEYDHVLEGAFIGMGYGIDQLVNNMVLPSFEDAESVAEDLKQYYMQLIKVS